MSLVATTSPAQMLKTVRSPTSRSLLEEAERQGLAQLDAELLQIVQEAELAHLHCRGRVPMEAPQQHFGHAMSDPLYKPPAPNGRDPGLISDVRLTSFDPESETLMVRMDSWQNLAFWAECHINLTQLQQWLALQGVEMQWHTKETEEEKEEMQ